MNAGTALPDGCGPAGLEVHRCAVLEVDARDRWSLIRLAAPGVAAAARPGQFVMVTLPRFGFWLRRPLSIHRVQADRLSLLIEARGEGTRRLAAARVGDMLELSGPLGVGFDVGATAQALLVAGGIGASPLQFLADELQRRGASASSFVGVRGRPQLDLLDAFDLPGLVVATEDGSRGVHGTVIDALDASAAADVAARHGAVLYGCGPWPMLLALRDWAAAHGTTGYGSLEAHMACGTGACHGCVFPTSGGYRRVCADGPVLSLDTLVDPSSVQGARVP